jgi:LPXTG-site transpeptidase (sortase) family protein
LRNTVLGGSAVLLLAGCGPASSAAGAAPAGAARATPSPIASPAADRFKSVRTYAEVAKPVRLRIAAAGVDTPLEPLGRAKDKSIELPTQPQLAGWFDGGPRPGQPGPAVIIGHVDWHGPAVFFRLRHLKPGDLITVDRADGTVARFTVTSRKQVAKRDFPTAEVYAPDLAPSLRLITCGGQFDWVNHNYLDNVIVFAAPV